MALNGDQFGDENITVDDSPFKSTLVIYISFHLLNIVRYCFQIYVDFKGESIDLLQLYGFRTQMGRYVALVMNNIFTKEEITTISLDDLLKDERYLIIKGKGILNFLSQFSLESDDVQKQFDQDSS